MRAEGREIEMAGLDRGDRESRVSVLGRDETFGDERRMPTTREGVTRVDGGPGSGLAGVRRQLGSGQPGVRRAAVLKGTRGRATM